MRRPAVGLFILLAAGTLAGGALGGGGAALAAFACAALAGALNLRRPPVAGHGRSAGWTALAVFLLGWASSALNAPRAWGPPPGDGSNVAVVGTVASDPERIGGPGASTAVWVFSLQVESNRVAAGQWAAAADSALRVKWFGPVRGQGPVYGDRMVLSGTLSGRRGVPVLVSGRRASRRLSSGHGSPVRRFAYRMRAAVSERLGAGIEFSPATRRVLDALMLGYRSSLGGDLRERFVRTGTLHLFAISGQHVCMLAGMAVMVLRAARVSRLYWALPLAPVLTLYTLATGAAPSAVRACVMTLVVFAAPLCGRRVDGLSALATAALLIVAVQPADLTRVGFVLSFTVTAGMIVLVPLLTRSARQASAAWRRRRDPRQAEWAAVTPLKPGLARRVVRSALHGLGVLTAFSVSAWLVSTPLTAYYFGRFTPIALLSNLAVVPLAYLVVLCGCLSLAGGLVGAFVTTTFNHANVALVGLLLNLTDVLSTVPGGCVEVDPPPATAVWAAMAALVAAAYLTRRFLARTVLPPPAAPLPAEETARRRERESDTGVPAV